MSHSATGRGSTRPCRSGCAIWAWVLKDEQDSGNQLAELCQLASRRGLEVTTESVLAGESAWKGDHREQLRWALDDAPVGRYDVVLVLARDRLRDPSALRHAGENSTRGGEQITRMIVPVTDRLYTTHEHSARPPGVTVLATRWVDPPFRQRWPAHSGIVEHAFYDLPSPGLISPRLRF